MESSSSTKYISLEEQQFIHRKGFISLAITQQFPFPSATKEYLK
jgi:hypothetical protein